jgi:CRP-like cAMP-binding protein
MNSNEHEEFSNKMALSTQKKEAFNDFLVAYKMKNFEKNVDQKSVNEISLPEEEPYLDMYLDKDQKFILETTRCLIRGHSTWKLRWDLLIMIMAIINCFSIPVHVSFSPNAMDSAWFRVLNAIIDICFIADVIISFRTTYIHPKTGNEIVKPKDIAWDYLKERFWIDFLASAPFDTIGLIILPASQATALRLFSLFKLVRVLRLNKLITIMKVEDEIKLSLKLIKLVFFLIMYLHCLACLWYYLVLIDEKWLPPLDFVYVTTHFYEEDLFFQYWSSLYHAVMMLSGNDLGPRAWWQLLFVGAAVLLGAIINANIFGELAVILSNLNRKASLFQAKLDIANTAMRNLSLPEKLQVSVTGFLTYSKALLESQQELECFFRMISPSLKQRVLKHLFYTVLMSNHVFLRNESWVEFVTRKLDTLILLPEYSIVIQGEKGENLYIISKGECVVHVTDQKGKKEEVNVLKSGAIFGEVALLCKMNRTASVKTILYSTIAQLHK